MKGFFEGSSTLVPGALRGYRAWDLTPDGRLASTGVPYVWPDGLGPHRAECLAARGPGFGCPCAACRAYSADQPERHDAPNERCGCGFWGWYDPMDTRIVPGPILGAVEVTGRVILGTHGFRAQSIRVLGLTGTAAVSAGLYARGHKLFPDRDALLEAFPPDDVSGLVEHRCDEECRRSREYSQVWFSPPGFMAQAIRQAAVDLAGVMQQANPVMPPPAAAEPDPPAPLGPREQALQARRNRNTGPDRKQRWWRR